jgi:acyl carrier protein
MTQPQIRARVREYVTENFLYMRQGYQFNDGDSLLGHGIVDSMGVIELITFVQDEFGIQVGEDEITEENFGTLAAIGSYVEGKRTAGVAVEVEDSWCSTGDRRLETAEAGEAVTGAAD